MDGTSMSDSSSSESTGSSPELDLGGWPANSGMGSREFNDMSSVLELDVGSPAAAAWLPEEGFLLGGCRCLGAGSEMLHVCKVYRICRSSSS